MSRIPQIALKSLRNKPSRRESRWRLFRGLFWSVLILSLLVFGGLVWLLSWSPGTPKVKRAHSEFFRCPCPLILAHQGASGHAPSNTMVGFRLAREMHADILEMDVHQSKDGVLVVSHDRTVDRLTDGRGLIREKTWAELQKLDAGYRFTKDGKSFPFRGKGVRIPSLRSVFETFPKMRFNLEIKQWEPTIEMNLAKLIYEFRMEGRVLIASFRTAPLLRWRKRAHRPIVTSGSAFQVFRLATFWGLGQLHRWESDIDAVQLPAKDDGWLGFLTTPSWIRALQGRGLHVHYWTVNEMNSMRKLLKAGANGIITDFPDRAWNVLRELNLR